jgi:hypothetical protein
MRVAIMQPYFFPYASYFRLFAAADTFILYDCVQFPRRGWVHRNRLPDAKGELSWLTLPVEHAHYHARIGEMKLAVDVRERLGDQTRRFPLLRTAPTAETERHLEWHGLAGGRPLVDYLEDTLRATAQALGVSRPIVRSSKFNIPVGVAAQDRILALCAAAGATVYINSPGGTALYDAIAFADHGVTLDFLEPWTGSYASILVSLVCGEAEQAKREIAKQSMTRGRD